MDSSFGQRQIGGGELSPPTVHLLALMSRHRSVGTTSHGFRRTRGLMKPVPDARLGHRFAFDRGVLRRLYRSDRYAARAWAGGALPAGLVHGVVRYGQHPRTEDDFNRHARIQGSGSTALETTPEELLRHQAEML